MPAMTTNWEWTCAVSGRAKMVRTAPAGDPPLAGPISALPFGFPRGRLRQPRAEPRLWGAPPAAARTRWYTGATGFRPSLRSMAKASLACQRTRWTRSVRRPKLALPGDLPPADVGAETLRQRCARLALQALLAHSGLLSTGGLGAGRDRWRGRVPQARGLRHDHSLRSAAFRRSDGSKRYALSKPTPIP